MLQIVALFTDNCRGVIYDCNIFISQATTAPPVECFRCVNQENSKLKVNALPLVQMTVNTELYNLYHSALFLLFLIGA